MNQLLDHIRKIIKAEGPISIARFMELALQHPEFGYYRKQKVFGASGDFVTSPEISQLFGEMIGLWCAEVWRQLGCPDNFTLLELGPGRGTMLQDALRATHKIEGFHKAMNLTLYECSERLQTEQCEGLAAYKPVYIKDLEKLPWIPTIAIANEFFDALPIHQMAQIELQGEKTWAERKVGLMDDELRFVFVPPFADGIRGEVAYHESSPLAASHMQILSAQIVRHGGAALVIDYGYVSPNGRSTLQAVSGHKHVDVLANPGEVDITAHVDFGVLMQKAKAQGAKIWGPIEQGDFLRAMGIEIRASFLQKMASPEENDDIASSLKRLTDPLEMGALFKVMALGAPSLKDVPGFE